MRLSGVPDCEPTVPEKGPDCSGWDGGWGGIAGELRAGGVAQGRSGLAGDDGAGVPIWLEDPGSQVCRLTTIFRHF
jgi:hypothetical protein